MKVMVIVHPGDIDDYEAGKMPDADLIENMMKFNEALVDAGVMQAGEGLHPSSQGMRLHFSGTGAPTVTQGSFGRDIVGGFWIWNVKSLDDALDWAKRAPMEEGATLEIREILEAEVFGEEIAERERELQARVKKQQSR